MYFHTIDQYICVYCQIPRSDGRKFDSQQTLEVKCAIRKEENRQWKTHEGSKETKATV
jgi:hypothetical protein